MYSMRLLGLRCCLMVNHKDIQVTSRVLEELYERAEMPLARRSFFAALRQLVRNESAWLYENVSWWEWKKCVAAPLPTLMPVSSLCKKCKNGNISTPEICLFVHQRTIGAYKFKVEFESLVKSENLWTSILQMGLQMGKGRKKYKRFESAFRWWFINLTIAKKILPFFNELATRLKTFKAS